MSDLKHVREYVFNQPWAIDDKMLNVIADIVCAHIRGEHSEAAETARPRPNGDVEIKRGIAKVPIMGVMMRRASMFQNVSGALSDWQLRERFEFAMASSAKVVLLHFDSPGGEVFGMQEMANMVFRARDASKTLVAWTDAKMTSRAYGIAAQAHDVYATPDAIVGSVGVVTKITDTSRKERNEGEDSIVIRSGSNKKVGEGPVTDAQLGPYRRIISQYAEGFYSLVERARNMPLSDEIKLGDIYTGKDAAENGLIDGTMFLEEIFNQYGAKE